jgi:hypothetical protein
MLRAELMARTSSRELSEWMALARVRHQEDEEARDRAESPDGQVFYHGREETDRDDDGGE